MKHDYAEPVTKQEPPKQTLAEQIGDAILISSVCLLFAVIIFAGL